jgi:predicted house-cleaning noncanonical NTP pyrophosphatase (MazG superfamily)
MNNWDQNNLNFLMSLTSEEFEQFMNDSSEDDLAYALELVQREKVSVLNLIEELHDSMSTEIDLSEAQAVLARFRL